MKCLQTHMMVDFFVVTYRPEISSEHCMSEYSLRFEDYYSSSAKGNSYWDNRGKKFLSLWGGFAVEDLDF